MPVPNAKRVHFQCANTNILFSRPTRDGRRVEPPPRSVVETAAALRAASFSPAEVAAVTATLRENDGAARLCESLASREPDATFKVLRELRANGTDTDITTELVLATLGKSRFESQQRLRETLTSLAQRIETEALDADVERQLSALATVRTDASDRVRRIRRLLPRVSEPEADRITEALEGDADHASSVIGDLERTHGVAADLAPGDEDAALASDLGELRTSLRARLAPSRAAPNMTLPERVALALGNPLAPHSTRAALQASLQAASISASANVAQGVTAALTKLTATPVLHPSQVSPLGYLHLERMSYSPAGIEHGELVSSVPLAPGEEVAIVHKEWANTEEEFHQLVADQFEDYSERGVVEKVDMAEATATQRTHSTAFSVSVSASGGFGPMTASASSSFSMNDSESSSRQASISQSQTTTQKASARSRKEHRTSFRLAKKTHVEDQTVRRIKNPDPLHPVRFDFFQVMRKWRVDLHRYGVRLTYDLTLPQPAVDLLAIYEELRELEDATEKAFDFDLEPSTIQRDTWAAYARSYGADVEPPPPQTIMITQTKIMGPVPEDDPYNGHVDEIRLAVPDGYVPTSRAWNNYNYRTNSEKWKLSISSAQPMGTVTTELVFPVYRQYVPSAIAWVWVLCNLLPEAEERWRMATYNAIRAAAHAQFLEARQILEQRRARLLADLDGIDALRLRRMEREELMKAVLRWMFGPSLHFFHPAADADFTQDGIVGSSQAQASTLAQGRIVSFLHQAIEWENINYFLYPYFWTRPQTWPTRLRLKHSDAIHEAFLRAGASRVVLPIRRGWETSFVAFLETGAPEATLPGNHPYMTVAEELEAFANTNYPGVIPANPDDVDPDAATKNAEGVLVASWYEYTPTSALDIKLGAAGPDEGAFVQTGFEPEGLAAGLSVVRGAFVNVLNALAARLASTNTP